MAMPRPLVPTGGFGAKPPVPKFGVPAGRNNDDDDEVSLSPHHAPAFAPARLLNQMASVFGCFRPRPPLSSSPASVQPPLSETIHLLRPRGVAVPRSFFGPAALFGSVRLSQCSFCRTLGIVAGRLFLMHGATWCAG
jgi:hypothetical protein